MTETLTERLTRAWDAGRTSGVISQYLKELTGYGACLPVESGFQAALGINFVPPLRDEDLTSRITEIVFPEATEAFIPRVPLGEKLRDLRTRAIKAGMELLNADGILEEVRRRRGELVDDEADV